MKLNSETKYLLRRIYETFGYDHGDDIKLWIKDKNDLLLEIERILDENESEDICDCVGLSHKDTCPHWVLPY